MLENTLLLVFGMLASSASHDTDTDTVGLNCASPAERPDLSTLPYRPAASTTLSGSGSSGQLGLLPGSSQVPSNRLDLVFVGDGYIASEMDLYASRVNALSNAFFSEAPYKYYESYFNVHRVDVVSNESGVDNDPSGGILRDTALDMAFAAAPSDASLSVNLSTAWAFAQNAPAADVVAAIANSNKWGGSGYPWADLGTAAASHASSGNLLKHELGHGLGKLADEYFTFGTTWEGMELPDPNVSIQTAEQMAASGTKWANWLGYEDEELAGPTQTSQGGKYFQFGIRRPTLTSKMRNSSAAFNAPSAEALVIEMYRYVLPIDASSDPNLIHDEFATLFVTPMQPLGHDLDVSWTVDGQELHGFTEHELSLCSLALSPGWHAVEVTVVDGTHFVRDETARAQYLTQTLLFPVFSNGGAAAESYCVATQNSTGSAAQIGFGGSTSLAQNDLSLEVAGAVPDQPGLFLSGTSMIQVPFGDGFRCAGGAVVRFPAVVVDATGDAIQALDVTSLPNGLVLEPGDERSFQFWYRDPSGGGSGFNLSDGLLLRLCP